MSPNLHESVTAIERERDDLTAANADLLYNVRELEAENHQLQSELERIREEWMKRAAAEPETPREVETGWYPAGQIEKLVSDERMARKRVQIEQERNGKLECDNDRLEEELKESRRAAGISEEPGDDLLTTTLLQLETKTAENTDLKMEIERLKGERGAARSEMTEKAFAYLNERDENKRLRLEIERLKREWIPGFREQYPIPVPSIDAIRKRNGRDPVPSDGDVEMDEADVDATPEVLEDQLQSLRDENEILRRGLRGAAGKMTASSEALNRYIEEFQAMSNPDRHRIIRSIVAYFGA